MDGLRFDGDDIEESSKGVAVRSISIEVPSSVNIVGLCREILRFIRSAIAA